MKDPFEEAVERHAAQGRRLAPRWSLLGLILLVVLRPSIARHRRDHRRHRGADHHAARGRPLLRGQALGHEGHRVLRRLRAADLVVPAGRDRVRRQGGPARRLLPHHRHDEPRRGRPRGRAARVPVEGLRRQPRHGRRSRASAVHFVIALRADVRVAVRRPTTCARARVDQRSTRCCPAAPAAAAGIRGGDRSSRSTGSDHDVDAGRRGVIEHDQRRATTCDRRRRAAAQRRSRRPSTLTQHVIDGQSGGRRRDRRPSVSSCRIRRLVEVDRDGAGRRRSRSRTTSVDALGHDLLAVGHVEVLPRARRHRQEARQPDSNERFRLAGRLRRRRRRTRSRRAGSPCVGSCS